MNYHDITKDDMLNGDGLRVVLWVQPDTQSTTLNPSPLSISSFVIL